MIEYTRPEIQKIIDNLETNVDLIVLDGDSISPMDLLKNYISKDTWELLSGLLWRELTK